MQAGVKTVGESVQTVATAGFEVDTKGQGQAPDTLMMASALLSTAAPLPSHEEPLWKNPQVQIAAGAAGLLVVLLGVWMSITSISRAEVAQAAVQAKAPLPTFAAPSEPSKPSAPSAPPPAAATSASTSTGAFSSPPPPPPAADKPAPSSSAPKPPPASVQAATGTKLNPPAPQTKSSASPNPAPPTKPSPSSAKTDDGPSIAERLTSPNYKWSEPVNLGPIVNREKKDEQPTVSADGLCLIFQSNRTGGGDLYESRRQGLDEPFGPPTPLRILNTGAYEMKPWLSADGLLLLFDSSAPRDMPQGGADLFQTRRAKRDAPWQPPTNLGAASQFRRPRSFWSPVAGRPDALLLLGSQGPGRRRP